MDPILKILQDLRPDIDFAASADFIKDYLLDSFDIMSLTAALEEEYHIQIKTGDILPENFQSVKTLAELIRQNGGTL